jgi:colicin import membrane protein
MRHDSNPTRALAVAVAVLALALGMNGASAQPAQTGADKIKSAPKGEPGKSGPKAGGDKDAYKPGHGHGHDHGPGHAHGGGAMHGAGKDAKRGAETKPVAALPPSPEVAKAVESVTASCPKALELRERIDGVVATRKASIAAIRTAQNEAKKQLRTVTTTKGKIERGVKKPGTDTSKDFETARAAYDAAVAQNATIASETQKLRAAEDELAAIATSADDAASACAAAEATLRMAAAEAKKAAAEARKESMKARGLARMPPPKALEAARAKQAADLEALQKSTAEARGALDALKAVAANPPAAAPAATAAAKKPAPAAAQ